MKKILISVLILIIVISGFNIVYGAQNCQINLQANKTEVQDGEILKINISIDTASQIITSLQFRIYTNKNIEIVSIKNANPQDFYMISNTENKTIALSSSQGKSGKIDICTLEIKVNKNTQSNMGIMYLDFNDNYSSCINNKEQNISIQSNTILLNINKQSGANNTEQQEKPKQEDINEDNNIYVEIEDENKQNKNEQNMDNEKQENVKDETLYKGVLPQTGNTIILLVICFIFLIIAIISYRKINQNY